MYHLNKSYVTVQVWLPNLGTVDGADDVKVVLVASGRCLADLPPLQVCVCVVACDVQAFVSGHACTVRFKNTCPHPGKSFANAVLSHTHKIHTLAHPLRQMDNCGLP